MHYYDFAENVDLSEFKFVQMGFLADFYNSLFIATKRKLTIIINILMFF